MTANAFISAVVMMLLVVVVVMMLMKCLCSDRLSSDCWGFTLRSPSAPEEDQTDEDSSDVVQKIETFANEINRKWMAPGAYDCLFYNLPVLKRNWAFKIKLQLTKCSFRVFTVALLINVKHNLFISVWCVLFYLVLSCYQIFAPLWCIKA